MISILIASKKEPYLWDTINDIQDNAKTKPEILFFEDDGRGQRASLNHLANQAKGDILIKVDAHCSFGDGFDKLLLEDFRDNRIIAPLLYPLDPKTWTVNHHNCMSSFGFNTQMAVEHMKGKGKSMCMQGSFFMISKKNWFKWNICDETLGSWGHQGTELGIKAYLNGGECYISDETYYGHVFRHEEKDFPYKRKKREIDNTHKLFIEKFKNKDIAPLIKEFNYQLN